MTELTLPNGWVITNFGELVVSMSNGYNGTQNKDGIGIPVSRIETIANEFIDFNKIGFISKYDDAKIAKYRLKKGEILFSHINSPSHLGKTAVFNSDKELYHGINLLRMIVEKKIIYPEIFNFYCKFSRSLGNFSLIAQHAVNQSSLNQKKLKTFNIILPPLNEQQRIANKLDQLLAQVDSIKSRIDNIPKVLKRFRQSVLNAAVTGKLTEQWRGGINNLNYSDWSNKKLGDLISLNPKSKECDTTNAGFVPMELVSSSYGAPAKYEIREWKEIKKGYTHFRNGDVIVAKITPCFENSKAAILSNLPNNLGAGSTEYHVLRPLSNNLITAKFIYIIIKLSKFLKDGKMIMTGTAGHKRVPKEFILNYPVDLPPIEEQTEIVKQVESLFAFSDQVEQRVKDAQARINNLTQSILAKAFRGELVPQDPNDEPASELLKRIQQERQQATALAKAVKKNPLKTKKKQHYVPQSYLRRFTIEGEKSLIWKFDKKKNEYNQTPASVKKICTEDYLYYIPDGDGFDHVTLEDKISEIEKTGNDIIIKIINDVNTNKPYVRISEEEKGYFAFYIGLMLTRGPSFRDPINNMHVQLARNTLNTLYQNGKLTEPPPELKKVITEKGINGVIKALAYSFVSIEPMLKHAEDNAISILEKNWYFLVAPDDLEFITSDTPVCCISSSEKIINLEPAHPDAALFFPISKKITLIIQGLCNSNNMLIYMREAKSIEIINQLIANEANEFIFCSTKYGWLANIITNKTSQKLRNLTGNCDDGVIKNPYKKKQNNHEKHDKTTV